MLPAAGVVVDVAVAVIAGEHTLHVSWQWSRKREQDPLQIEQKIQESAQPE